jgi:hypothetical protein
MEQAGQANLASLVVSEVWTVNSEDEEMVKAQ